MKEKSVVVFIDAPDPDNFVLVLAAAKCFPDREMCVALTGRPVRFNATQEHATWQWDAESSRLAQEASAARLKNFMRNLGIRITSVFDGGIAPRTLVPHRVHFEEYYKFQDVDPLAAMRYSDLEPQEDLVDFMLEHENLVLVGGPMTGLKQVLERNPDVAKCITEVHAMFATWGTVDLMDLGGAPRGANQFNVACDPVSAHFVLNGLTCPIYLMPTEVTRHGPIGFSTVQELRSALPQNDGVNKMLPLYALWYDAAVKPRQDANPQEKIFIHDVVSALSADPTLRDEIYEVVPVQVTSVPHLPSEKDLWGVVEMQKLPPEVPANIFAATSFAPEGEQKYLEALYKIFV